MIILQQLSTTVAQPSFQLHPILSLVIGALLAIVGGFFGVLIRVRVERKEEINFIKICLIDELNGICSIIESMKDTFTKSPVIYPVDLNKLTENTTNFNDHRKRIYLIKDENLRKNIFNFYKDINTLISDSTKSITLEATPTNSFGYINQYEN